MNEPIEREEMKKYSIVSESTLEAIGRAYQRQQQDSENDEQK